MPDILDDSYESDLTDEEHKHLILMSEHAIASRLSAAAAAAQAVLDAYWDDTPLESGAHCGLAAALRAIADQVVPHEPLKGSDPEAWGRDEIRTQLLAIADELEDLQD